MYVDSSDDGRAMARSVLAEAIRRAKVYHRTIHRHVRRHTLRPCPRTMLAQAAGARGMKEPTEAC